MVLQRGKKERREEKLGKEEEIKDIKEKERRKDGST